MIVKHKGIVEVVDYLEDYVKLRIKGGEGHTWLCTWEVFHQIYERVEE